jgi:hypothetical protein
MALKMTTAFTLGCGHSSLQLELTLHDIGTGLGWAHTMDEFIKEGTSRKATKRQSQNRLLLSTVSHSKVDFSFAQLGYAGTLLSKNYSVADRVAATSESGHMRDNWTIWSRSTRRFSLYSVGLLVILSRNHNYHGQHGHGGVFFTKFKKEATRQQSAEIKLHRLLAIMLILR